MPLEVHSVPRPDWAPLPRDGCRGAEVKVLLEDDRVQIGLRIDGRQQHVHEALVLRQRSVQRPWGADV